MGVTMDEPAALLIPFPTDDPPAGMRLVAGAVRVGDVLAVRFRLTGDTADIPLPLATGPGSRRDDLWRDTCFEVFVAVAGEPRYAEANLAPSLDWNVYLFDGYRRGMRPDPAAADPARAIDRAGGALTATFGLPLAGLDPRRRGLEVGLAAVIRAADGRLGHWALDHSGERLDFHRREGFLLRC
jgi:hypothetical protein